MSPDGIPLQLPAGAIGHEATYYSRTAACLHYFPPAEGQLQADVCIIGGGLAGLTAATELANRGRAVVLVEARRIGWSASGRNGGFVSPGFAQSVLTLEEQLGIDHARSLFKLSGEGAAYVRRAIREDGDKPAILGGQGALKFIRHGDVAGLDRRVERMAHDYGYMQTFLSRRELVGHVTTNRYQAGVLDMSAFQVHPLEYTQLLARKANAAGAKLHENSFVHSLSRIKSGDWLVQTADARIKAQSIILATSAHKGPSKRLNGAVVPVSTYVVTAASSKLASAVRFAGALGDTRRSSDYYRLVGSPTGPLLLWGGRITTRISRPADLSAMMRKDILSVYPQLDDLRIIDAWTGLMGYAIHKMPLIGKLDERVWMATAFGGHGLNTTAMGGLLIARAICDGDESWKLFAPFKPDWAGGTLGKLAVQAEYWRLRLLDRLEEKRAMIVP